MGILRWLIEGVEGDIALALMRRAYGSGRDGRELYLGGGETREMVGWTPGKAAGFGSGQEKKLTVTVPLQISKHTTYVLL